MRIAVLSDIHGNLEALEAVIADLKTTRVTKLVCLGDLVGYGPDPEAVVTLVRQMGCLGILGNHEAALAQRKERERMNFQAKENNISTANLLSAANQHYCSELPRTLTLEGALFVHGCPPDSVNTYLYMLPDEEVVRLFAEDPHQLFFVGHTHELLLIWQQNGKVVRRRPTEGKQQLKPGGKYLINCGSVGQPRDDDRRSKYLLWDSEESTLEVRAVDYDVEKTAEKIVRLGFPKTFADRLR